MQIREVLHYLFQGSDILVTGLKIWVPVLFVLILIKAISKQLSLPLIKATSLSILLAGIMFTIAFITDVTLTFINEGSDNADFIKSALTGPHWYQYILPVVNFAMLPHLEWIPRMRRTIYSSFFIILCWIGGFAIVYYNARSEGASLLTRSVMPKIDITGSLWDFIIVVLLSTLIAVALNFKNKAR